MSENGSETVLDDTEPSMEDILASIRRIISEEEDLVVSDVSQPAQAANSKSAAAASTSEFDQSQVSGSSNDSYDSVDAMVDFDDVLLLDDSYQVEDLEIPNANAIAAKSEASAKPTHAKNIDVEPLNTQDVKDVDILKLSELFDDEPDATFNTDAQAMSPTEVDVVTADAGDDLNASDAEPALAVDETLDLVIDTEPEENAVMDAAPENEPESEPDLKADISNEAEPLSAAEAEYIADDDVTVEIEEFEAIQIASAPNKQDDEIDAILRILDGKPAGADKVDTLGDLADMDVEPEVEAASGADKPMRRDTSISNDEDIDIVKSLMADLTGPNPAAAKSDTQASANGLAEDMNADASAPETEATLSQAETEDDLLGEIVDMSIESEEQLKAAEASSAAKQDSALSAVSEAEPEQGEGDDADNALLAIAAQAEKDAEAAAGNAQTLKDKQTTKLETSALSDAADILAAADSDTAAQEIEPVDATSELLDTAEQAQSDAASLPQSAPDEIEDATLEIDISEPEASDKVAQADEIQLEELTDPSISPDNSGIVEESDTMASATQQQDNLSSTLIDDVTETATREAFASLTVAVEERSILDESGPRIGDVVQDALRPMLKEWLDDNLQGIVERAVAKEVKRLSSGK